MQRLIFKFAIPAGLFLVLLVWGLPRTMPSRQLDRAEADLMTALERARRGLLEKRLAGDYADQWGQDKTVAIEEAMNLARQFYTLQIDARRVDGTPDGLRATTTLEVRATGRGTAVAAPILSRVNSINTPFVLEWRRDEWKPWSWRLVRVTNAGLPDLR